MAPPETPAPARTAIIIGAGAGLSGSLARRFHAEGLRLVLAARNTAKLAALAQATGAHLHACDAGDPAQMAALFAAADALVGPPDIVVYNASLRARGSIAELDPAEVEAALRTTAFGAFLAGREAARRMLPRGSGTILFSGATAGVKGFALSAPFAMGKFALRGLAQSMARELHPRGVHVVHVVIDGGIRSDRRPEDPARPDALLHPDAIAETYWQLARQQRSAWSAEIELRPWVESF
jgi:NAD(P)-dependent dehydrogenase (short-subunit alcohol dehydrogenase family)